MKNTQLNPGNLYITQKRVIYKDNTITPFILSKDSIIFVLKNAEHKIFVLTKFGLNTIGTQTLLYNIEYHSIKEIKYLKS